MFKYSTALSWFSIFMSFIAISLSAAHFADETLELKYSSILSVSGLLVTGAAFVTASYFAFQAIDVVNRTKQIEILEKSISNMSSDFSNMEEKFVQFFINSINQEINKINSQFQVKDSSHNKLKNRRDELNLLKCRLGCDFPLMEFETRKILLREISVYGKLEDINRLTTIIDDPNEHSSIIEISKRSRKSIIRRIGKS